VPSSGSKKYKLNRSKGRTRITLSANCHGTPVHREIFIIVRKARSSKAKGDNTVYDSYTRMDKPNLQQRFKIFRERLSYAWQYVLAQKKFAYKILLLLLVVMLISAFIPKVTYFGLLAVAAYLLWYIYKK
jgi:hypothetical protein